MRCICLRGLALLAAACSFWLPGLRWPSSLGSPRRRRVRFADRIAGARRDARRRPRSPASADRARSSQAVFQLRPSTSRRRERHVKVATPKATPADESLSPIPDPQEGPPPPLVAASFKGVAPGTSTASGRCSGLGPAEEDSAKSTVPWWNSIPSSRSSGWK